MPSRTTEDDTFDTSDEAMAEAVARQQSVIGDNAAGALLSVIERVEKLRVEKAEIAEQEKEVWAEAKGMGFDVKIGKKVVKIRAMDRAKRQEEETILGLYLSATGDL
jgi:uncharacterized protein (UPF0335 family)